MMVNSTTKGAAAAGKQSLWMRYLRAPLRLVVRVRDLYVQSMTGGGNNVVYGNAMGCPTPHIPSAPRNFSAVNSPSPSHYRTAGNQDKARPMDQFRRSKSALPLGGGDKVAPEVAPRRHTVTGFERIDEDEGLDWEEEQEKVGLLERGGN